MAEMFSSGSTVWIRKRRLPHMACLTWNMTIEVLVCVNVRRRECLPSSLFVHGCFLPACTSVCVCGESNIHKQGEGRSLKHQRKHPEELRAVIAITRHGDRTPKQKMKMKISFPEFLAFYNKYSPGEMRQREAGMGVGRGGKIETVILCKRQPPEVFKVHTRQVMPGAPWKLSCSVGLSVCLRLRACVLLS